MAIKKSKKKRRKSTICSPLSKSKSSNTCFSREALLRIASSWNRHHTSSKDKIKISKNNRVLWNTINKRFDKYCDEESCWLEQDFIDKEIKKSLAHHFKPKMPQQWAKNPNEWLTTVDIRNVMKQYDKKFPHFLFIGPVPIDFDASYDTMGTCIVNELCKINVKQLTENSINKLGVIFNTDPHHKSGEHWIALFIDLRKGIYFFDSYGIKPPKEVFALMKRIQNQGKKLGKKLEMKYNMIQHQFKNSECGVYSMNFIIELLHGKEFKEIIEDVISDDEMNKHRLVLYRK